MIDRDQLIGTWRRAPGAAATLPYPHELELRPRGIYEARRDPGTFTIWDVGTYRIRDDETIVISTATDAEVPYAFAFSGDELVIRDEEGNELRFVRD